MLDGILPSDLKVPESEEKGVPLRRSRRSRCRGAVTVGGAPVAEAFVALTLRRPEEDLRPRRGRQDRRPRAVPDHDLREVRWRTGDDYFVTITKVNGPIPALYTAPATTTLKLKIHETPNTLSLDLPAN